MKILIATGIYPPSVGGPATYSKILHDELPKQGIEVKVISFDEVRHLPKGLSHIIYFIKILQSAGKCDIVYSMDPVSVGLPSMIAARILRRRFFLKVVGDYAWEQGTQRLGVNDSLDDFSKNHSSEYPILVRILRKTETFVALHAEKIIVPSRYLKKIVSRWGIPENKITVVYNSFEGVVPETGVRGKTQIGGKVIISAGRLVPWKGFLGLVETMIPLSRKFPDLKLCIIGDGPERGAIERRIKQLDLVRQVYMIGAVPQVSLFEYIRQGSVFVLNTGYEGFSHQLLEVLALGTPLVTTSVGGNPEIVEDGKNGLLVAYNDKEALSVAIERMIRDDDFRSACVLAGKETAGKFSRERMVDSLIQELK